MAYTKDEVIRVSIVQICFGGLLFLLTAVCSGICLVKNRSFSLSESIADTGSGYWTAILCLVTGILGTVSAYKNKLNLLPALYLVMNLLVIISAFISFGLECWGVAFKSEFSFIETGGSLIVYIFMLIVIFVVFVVGCVGACMNCSGYGISEGTVQSITTFAPGQGTAVTAVVVTQQYQQSSMANQATAVNPQQNLQFQQQQQQYQQNNYPNQATTTHPMQVPSLQPNY